MRVHITKAGQNLLLFVGGIAAVFIFAKLIAIAQYKIVMKKVNSIPIISNAFVENDISYSDMASLKRALDKLSSDICKYITTLKKYNGAYPNKTEIKEKLAAYETYFQSLNNHAFTCPEHITSKTEVKTEPCSKCKGKGERKRILSRPKPCEFCNGIGKISCEFSVTNACPNCGSEGERKNPSQKNIGAIKGLLICHCTESVVQNCSIIRRV